LQKNLAWVNSYGKVENYYSWKADRLANWQVLLYEQPAACSGQAADSDC